MPPRMICICGKMMSVRKNGVYVKVDEASNCYGDLWKCNTCGNRVLDGFGGYLPPDITPSDSDWVFDSTTGELKIPK